MRKREIFLFVFMKPMLFLLKERGERAGRERRKREKKKKKNSLFLFPF